MSTKIGKVICIADTECNFLCRKKKCYHKPCKYTNQYIFRKGEIYEEIFGDTVMLGYLRLIGDDGKLYVVSSINFKRVEK